MENQLNKGKMRPDYLLMATEHPLIFFCFLLLPLLCGSIFDLCCPADFDHFLL